MNFCPKCGAKLEGDFAFCPECGNSLTVPETNAGAAAYTEPAQTAEPTAYTEPAQTAEPTAYTEPVQPAGYTVNAPGAQAAPAQNKKKLGIIIGAAVALILILVIALASCAGGGSSYDTDNAVSFRVDDLTCYAPQGWSYDASSSADSNATVYTFIEDGEFAFVMVASIYSAKGFDEMKDLAYDSYGAPFSEIDLPWADNAIYMEEGGYDDSSIHFIGEGDGCYYVITVCASPGIYDRELFTEMVKAYELD